MKNLNYTLIVLFALSLFFNAYTGLVNKKPDTKKTLPILKGDEDEEPEVTEFLPGIIDSIKKGLGLTDETIEDAENELIKDKTLKEAKGFEDPSEKKWSDSIAKLQEDIENQDIIAQAAKALKEQAMIYAQKKTNEYVNNQGSPSLISVRTGLSRQEKDFRAARFERKDVGTNKIVGTRTAIQKFLGQDFDRPTLSDASIAFVGTGGGYRALILTGGGYLSGLEEIGLLDAITYVSGVSGSTWALGPWISQGGTASQYKQSLLQKITDKKFNVMKLGPALLSSGENIDIVARYIVWPKMLWGQPIRSIDFYGYLLGQVLLGNDGYKKRLSDQSVKVASGMYPYPIYTAVSMSKKEDDSYSYDWYQFTPNEIMVEFYENKDDLAKKSTILSVPVRAFGSEFNAGKSISTGHVTVAPEMMFGYWLGTFGSAFAINSKDINAYVKYGFSNMKQSLTSFDGLINTFALAGIGIIQSIEGVGSARISPAQLFNPFKNYSQTPIQWLKDKKYLTLVDAGVANNIPLMPLLWPERKIKFIIIGEASITAGSARELKKFFDEAKLRYGYTYERVDDGNNVTLRLYKDKTNKQAPRIIYINYLKEPKLMALTGPKGIGSLTDQEKIEREKLRQFIKAENLDSFDPVACIESMKSFCNTLNFEYTQDQFKQLAGMAQFNMMANKEVIAEFIRDELENKDEIDWGGWGNP